MVKRIVALVFIVVCSSAAWMVLSVNMKLRTDERGFSMSDAVGGLWGTEQHQVAPTVGINWENEKRVEMNNEAKLSATKKKLEEEQVKAKMEQRNPRKMEMKPEEFIKIIKEKHDQLLTLSASDINVDLSLDYRQKGLLWFSTYTVDFKAQYKIENPVGQDVNVAMTFPFPSAGAVYDNMAIEALGRQDLQYNTRAGQNGATSMVANFVLPAKASQLITFRCRALTAAC